MTIYPDLEKCADAMASYSISQERKEVLKNLATLITEVSAKHELINLNFICTHNSRRSQIAELTMRMHSAKLGLNHISTFSGGTESTALNERVVNALVHHGFKIEKVEEGENPVYATFFSDDREEEPAMFSKTFEDDSNPEQFIAVMVCGDAEENCPFIPNAEHRFALTYKDPKFSDDSDQEEEVYQEKVIEIGSQMLYLCQLLNS